MYAVEEGNVIDVCTIVYEPTGSCPIAFNFTVEILTFDKTAGGPLAT